MSYDTRLNPIVAAAHYMIYWDTPYRTGNLARNGISDYGVRGMPPNSVGFRMFDRKGTEYGWLLNEAPFISWRLTNPNTGVMYKGTYKNKHYRWVDNFADSFANEIPSLFPNVRRV